MERKFNEKLVNFKWDNKISDSLYNKFCSLDGLFFCFYGLLKIYKFGYFLRFIVLFIDFLIYMLLKYLV